MSKMHYLVFITATA